MNRYGLAGVFYASTLLFASGAAHAGVETALSLVPHRAVYDLKLKDLSDRSGIEGMFGRMVYEFTGSACSGFTTNFRFVTKIDTGEEQRVTDQQTTTFENIKARQFRFDTKSFTDEKLDKQVTGEATDAKTNLAISLAKPDKRDVTLTPSQFPTEHMLEVIDHAKQGKRFFEARVFDGSEDGDKTLLTSTVVGAQQQPKADDEEAQLAGEFAKTPYWPVTIAYYNEDAQSDSTPVYRMSFKLYDNGITRDLTMDYGDFVLSGTLSKLEVLGKPAQEKCN
ncbi:cell envelope integrity EipB family protein [Rhizobium lemnae]|uniref:Cell envelope integrity EipB family protein n=1 Tax=Rhizobium lemnae TaxID=1214924 RepID=A0ABV8E7V4_9HYPH|nr:cell envelope integrity EipB family protein [Rhizobium lemnae]MCJ8509005.1 cell envelope integrity EipB family protein [Rhizobium lemnae]